jgi:hypothetical protein
LIVGQVENAPSGRDTHDGFTKEEVRRARALDKKIKEQQRKLNELAKQKKADRKQFITDLVSPPKVSKRKQNKVESKQEVKADIPLADTQELERSIRYLEAQKNNILQTVAYRQELARIQTQLAILEAKRLEELDDEEAILLLL